MKEDKKGSGQDANYYAGYEMEDDGAVRDIEDDWYTDNGETLKTQGPPQSKVKVYTNKK